MAFPPTHGTTPNEKRPDSNDAQSRGRADRVDLNHCSKQDLIDAAGLSPESAECVLRFRNRHRGIQNWTAFDQIPLPTDDLDRLRPHVQF